MLLTSFRPVAELLEAVAANEREGARIGNSWGEEAVKENDSP